MPHANVEVEAMGGVVKQSHRHVLVPIIEG